MLDIVFAASVKRTDKRQGAAESRLHLIYAQAKMAGGEAVHQVQRYNGGVDAPRVQVHEH